MPIVSDATAIPLGHLLSKSPLRFQVSIVDEDCIRAANASCPDFVDHFFLREEFIWVRYNTDPLAYCRSEGVDGTAAFLKQCLRSCLEALVDGQYLNFRSLDIRSDEFQHFAGAERSLEHNPQMGLHGIRHVLTHPDFLLAELKAIHELRSEGYNSLLFSLPFLTLVDELIAVQSMAERNNLLGIPIGVFVETPSAVYELPEIVEHRPAAVYIGTKDLTQFILVCDRSNLAVSSLFSMTSRPVLIGVAEVLKTCARQSIPVFVFVVSEDLRFYLNHFPEHTRYSLPRAEYIRIIAEYMRINGR